MSAGPTRTKGDAAGAAGAMRAAGTSPAVAVRNAAAGEAIVDAGCSFAPPPVLTPAADSPPAGAGAVLAGIRGSSAAIAALLSGTADCATARRLSVAGDAAGTGDAAAATAVSCRAETGCGADLSRDAADAAGSGAGATEAAEAGCEGCCCKGGRGSTSADAVLPAGGIDAVRD